MTLQHKDGATVKSGFEYLFATDGNITRTNQHDGSYWTYGYDADDRLTAATRYNNSQQAVAVYGYTYDAAGNIVTKVSPAGQVAMSYDAGNRLTSAYHGPGNLLEYFYDSWGRLTQEARYDTWGSSPVAQYAWRYDGKLYSVSKSSGTTTYQYGGDGKRRARAVGGTTTTRYRWGLGWDVLNEENGSGTLTNMYIGHLAEVPGSNPATGAYRYYATDLIRSTRALFDQSKAQVAGYEYTPYGELYASSGTASTTHMFTGHDWDATSGLYFAKHQYYDPNTGRWIGPNIPKSIRYLRALLFWRSGIALLPDSREIKGRTTN